ncbi:MAG: hypothetical protein D8M61_02940 [Ignavibacteriae bacterium]|nr:hypothetical protein [Ignavibacteriota bacterium]
MKKGLPLNVIPAGISIRPINRGYSITLHFLHPRWLSNLARARYIEATGMGNTPHKSGLLDNLTFSASKVAEYFREAKCIEATGMGDTPHKSGLLDNLTFSASKVAE